jgi:hypothetical protein
MLFSVLAYIAVTILRVAEVEGGCSLKCRSVSGGKDGSVEFGVLQWEPSFMHEWLRWFLWFSSVSLDMME